MVAPQKESRTVEEMKSLKEIGYTFGVDHIVLFWTL